MSPPNITDRAPPTVVTNGAPLRSRLPRRLRVVILFVLSLGIQSGLWSGIAPILGNELGAISKTHDDLLRPFAHLAYKVAIIGLGWSLDYDCRASQCVKRVILLTNPSARH